MERVYYIHPETGQRFSFKPGTTPQEARTKMDTFYAGQQAAAEQEQAAQAKAYRDYRRTTDNALMSGVRRGIGQIPMLGEQALAAGAGFFGANETRDALLNSAAQRAQQIERDNPRLYDSFSEDPLGYSAGVVGEQLPQLGVTIGSGGAGALIGRGLAAMGARGAAAEAAKQAALKGAMRGGAAGAGLSGLPMNVGDAYGSYVDEYGVENASPGAAIAAGGLMSAADALGGAVVGRMVSPTDLAKLGDKKLLQAAERGRLKSMGIDAAKAAGLGAATQGPLEGLQEGIKFGVGDVSQGGGPFDFVSDPDKLAQIGQEALAGAIGGGGISAPIGAVGGFRAPGKAKGELARRAEEKEKKSILEQLASRIRAQADARDQAEIAAAMASGAPGKGPRLDLFGNPVATDDQRRDIGYTPRSEMDPTMLRSTDSENRMIPGVPPVFFDRPDSDTTLFSPQPEQPFPTRDDGQQEIPGMSEARVMNAFNGPRLDLKGNPAITEDELQANEFDRQNPPMDPREQQLIDIGLKTPLDPESLPLADQITLMLDPSRQDTPFRRMTKQLLENGTPGTPEFLQQLEYLYEQAAKPINLASVQERAAIRSLITLYKQRDAADAVARAQARSVKAPVTNKADLNQTARADVKAATESVPLEDQVLEMLEPGATAWQRATAYFKQLAESGRVGLKYAKDSAYKGVSLADRPALDPKSEERAKQVWDSVARVLNVPAWDELADTPFFVDPKTGELITLTEDKETTKAGDMATDATLVADDVKREFARQVAAGLSSDAAYRQVLDAVAAASMPFQALPENLKDAYFEPYKKKDKDANQPVSVDRKKYLADAQKKIKKADKRVGEAEKELAKAATPEQKQEAQAALDAAKSARADLVIKPDVGLYGRSLEPSAAEAARRAQEREAQRREQEKAESESVLDKFVKGAAARIGKPKPAPAPAPAPAPKPKKRKPKIREDVGLDEDSVDTDWDQGDLYIEDPNQSFMRDVVDEKGTPISKFGVRAIATRLNNLARQHLKGVNVVVLETNEDLIRARGIDPNLDAAIKAKAQGVLGGDGAVYVLMPNIKTVEGAELTLFHEPGHLFMRSLTPGERTGMFGQLTNNKLVQAEKRKWLSENADRMKGNPAYDWNAMATEEAIVELGGQQAFGPAQAGFRQALKRTAAQFINKLRSLGLTNLANMLTRLNDDVQVVEALIEARRQWRARNGGVDPNDPAFFRKKDQGPISIRDRDVQSAWNLRSLVDGYAKERSTLWGALKARLGAGAEATLAPMLDLRTLATMLDRVGAATGVTAFEDVGSRLYRELHLQSTIDQSVQQGFKKSAIDPLAALKEKNLPLFEKVEDMLLRASFMRFDPREDIKGDNWIPKGMGKADPKELEAIKAERVAFQKEYKALPEEGRKAIDAVFTTTRRAFEEMTSALVKNAETMLSQTRRALSDVKDIDPKEEASLKSEIARRVQQLEKLNQAIEQLKEVLPYVPFRRKGDHLIQFVDPATGSQVIWAYEHQYQRDAAYTELTSREFDIPGKGRVRVTQAEKFNRYEDPNRMLDSLDAVSRAVVKAFSDVQRDKDTQVAAPSDPTKPIKKADTPEAQFQKQLDQVKHHLIDTLALMSPAGRFLSAATARENYPGMDKDIMASLSGYAVSLGRDISNLRQAVPIGNAFADANRLLAASAKDDKVAGVGENVDKKLYLSADDLNTARVAVNEINKRYEFIRSPVYSPWANNVTKGGFMFFMGLNPSSALLQLMQLVMVQAPILAGKYGVGNAYDAMIRGTGKVFSGGQPLRKFLEDGEAHRLGRYDSTKLNADGTAMKDADEITKEYAKLRTSDKRDDQYRAMMVDLLRRGALNDQAAQELADLREGKDPTRASAKVERVASYMMQYMEQTNRLVSLVAAFDLGASPTKSWNTLADEIAQHVYEGHGDYSALNSPRPWHSNTGKVLLLFKKFAFHMYTTMGMLAFDAIRAEKNSAARREAATKLGVMLLVTGALTGAAGMPLYGLFSTLYGIFMSMFGDDEDTRNLAVALRRAAVDAGAGETPTGIVLNGLPSLLGLNLTSRLGYADVFFRDPDENLDQRKTLEWMAQTVGGPMYGAVDQMVRGARLIAGGDVVEGAATMMGAAPRNLYRGIEQAVSGEATTNRGDQIAEVGLPAAALQILGFAPGDVQTQQDIMFAAKAVDVRLNATRARALEMYRNAYVLGDTSRMERAEELIDRVNDTADRLALPKYRITPETLRRSVKARVENNENFDRGVRFAPATAAASERYRDLAPE